MHSTQAPREWFGHPRGLTILFMTGTWELFAYFGMNTLLVYYMVRQLSIAQERASLIYGSYIGLTYFTPLIGGFLADRWLGRRRAVIAGNCIMSLGLFMMAAEQLFMIALVTIIIGYGLFLTNLPGQIAGLYGADDPRLRVAYNHYYVGLNVGALLAPLACGTIGELYGWNWGFPVAGAGMLVGLATYLYGQRYLPPDASWPGIAPTSIMKSNRSGQQDPEAKLILGRFVLLGSIASIVILFRTAYMQLGNTLPLWIETADRAVGGFVIPKTWFLSLGCLLAIILTPLFSAHWLRLASRSAEPSPITKMALGAGLTALAFLVLAAVAFRTEAAGTHASWLWLLIFFGVLGFGEVHMLPVGLGLFGALAPKGFQSTAIALWFAATFFGSFAAGVLGTLWSHLSPPQFFTIIAAMAGLSALLLLPFRRAARRAASS